MSTHHNILSLGGGLQSTTLLLISLHGVIDKPDCAIFADTGWERDATYKNVELLREYAAQFDVQVYTAKPKQSILDNLLHGKSQHVPFYSADPQGKKGQRRRQCTDHYKIRPIRKMLKNIYGKDVQFNLWIGISLDEALRMKPSPVKYITHKYPLVDMRWTRQDCENWLKENGFGVPSRSSCIGCPYHSQAEWKRLTEDECKEAISIDEHIRHKGDKGYDYYLSSSRTPLREVFNNPTSQLNLFETDTEECTGMCFL